MPFNNPKLAIGFITYGKSTAKYLPYFLPNLSSQSPSGDCDVAEKFKVIVFDNTESLDNENIIKTKSYFPEAMIMGGNGNKGFAGAYNKMIKAMDNDSELGSVFPKIMKWDFKENKKTNIIDSCGIQLKSGLRFVDVGQGEADEGQFNDVKILGTSGAAGMYRISALKKIGFNKKPPSGYGSHSVALTEYFDELMFMYKEDCDLAYRLFLAGFKSKCVAGAIVYHDRTAHAKGESNLKIALNRKSKSRQVKKWSFLGQQIIFIKYWHLQNFWNKLAIVWHEIKMIIFILLFEQYLLGEFWQLWKIRKKISYKSY